MTQGRDHRVIVGIDGSPASLAALRWALREAAATDSTVEVVHCWQPHSLTELLLGSPAELQRGSVCMLHNEVQAALADVDLPHPVVRQTSRRGRPARALLERATTARLLVLGAHGHTELQDLAFGQVTATCLRHSSCPVVIVDGTDTLLQHTGRPIAAASVR